MTINDQIQSHISSLSEPKQSELRELYSRFSLLMPDSKLWYFDGKDETGKVVTNPNIGFGEHTIHYKDGSTKEFYKVGISANKTGISVYLFGIDDKNYLAKTYGDNLGKAKITGYCIHFKTINDIDLKVLDEVVRDIMQIKNPD